MLYNTTDWTAVWVHSQSLTAGEAIISGVLLSLTLLIEVLATLVHHNRDKSPADYSLARRLDPEKVLSLPRTLGYNFKSHFISIPGIPHLHYISEGPHDSPKVLLLLHGEPFWSFCWTRLIPHLGGDVRIVVPDLPGFGLSDKPVDWRQYNLALHKKAITGLIDKLGLDSGGDLVLVGHNWGWMVGAAIARDRPHLFSKLVILNTNNLPDGEAELSRYKNPATWAKFLVLNSFFLVFRASMNLLREHFPLGLMIHSLNPSYSKTLVDAMVSPWPRTEDCGGTTAFPLMVPVYPSHPEAREMTEIRNFLSQWPRPVLILYSNSALLPWLPWDLGDFVVGTRALFYRILIPGVRRVQRIDKSGHLVMWDQPRKVAREIIAFINIF